MRKKSRKKKKSLSRSIIKGTLLIGVAFLLGIGFERYNLSFEFIENYVNDITYSMRSWMNNLTSATNEDVYGEVHFFDVGQGSSILLKDENETTILIDTGRHDDGDNRIIDHLDKEIGVGGKIDLLIFTHNDADHIGNGDLVLNYFQVDEVWMNGMDHTTQTYTEVLDAVLETDADYAEPKAGEVREIGDFSIHVLHPNSATQKNNQNDESIATRIQLGNHSMITTGDIASSVEREIIEERRFTLQSDIMVVGHHGSNRSTSPEWINAVNPSLAIYQAGENNTYGHPHQEVIDSLDASDIDLMGTDEYGTISLISGSDGEWSLTTDKER